MPNASRTAEVHRKTNETDIALILNLDGRGASEVSTGVPFFDHMLESFAKHALFDLHLRAKGDLEAARPLLELFVASAPPETYGGEIARARSLLAAGG